MEFVKLDDVDYNELLDLQKRWLDLMQKYGEITYQIKTLESESSLMSNMIDELDDERYTVVQRLQEKHGQGHVNLATGEFFPDPSTTT
jgi:predicted nuclease with TOPRIM domain